MTLSFLLSGQKETEDGDFSFFFFFMAQKQLPEKWAIFIHTHATLSTTLAEPDDKSFMFLFH